MLDAGNSRVKVLDDETFAFKTHIVNEGKTSYSPNFNINRRRKKTPFDVFASVLLFVAS